MSEQPPAGFPEIISAKTIREEDRYLLAELFKKAADSQKIVTVAVSDDRPEQHKALAKRRHDIKAAIRTLGFMITAVKSGYTFSDDKAAAKIEAIEKAVACLSRESDVLVQILASDP